MERASDMPAFAGRIAAGLVAGIAATFYLVSFVTILIRPIAPDYAYVALWFGILAAAIAGMVIVVTARRPVLIWQAQSVVVVVLHAAAEQISVQMTGASQASIFATFAVVSSATALVTALAMAAFGLMRTGALGKSIPRPVLGGFLAATGLLLVVRAWELGTGAPMQFPIPHILVGGPPLVLALLTFFAARRFSEPVALGIGTVLVLALSVVQMPSTTGQVAAGGAGVTTLPYLTGPVDWSAVMAAAPFIATAAALAVLSLLLNLGALDKATHGAIDADHALRWSSPVNIVNAAVSGLVTFPSYTLTQLAWTLDSRPGKLGIAVAAIIPVALLIAGPEALGQVPVTLFAYLLSYLGIGIMHKWLWQELGRMPRPDALLLAAIFVVTLVYGFVAGVVIGTAAAALRFTLAYARVPILRARLDAGMRPSSIERSEDAMRTLMTHGAETAVVQLQGFLFFGSVQRLEKVFDDVLDQTGAIRLIIDLSHVQGLDVSAVETIHQGIAKARATNRNVMLCGMTEGVHNDLWAAGEPNAVIVSDIDAAITEVEREILGEGDGASPTRFPMSELVKKVEAASPGKIPPAEHLAPGSVVLEQGAPADDLVLLETGRLVAEIMGRDGAPVRVASFLPGAIVGEIALFAGGRRTASVVTETDCTIRRLSRETLDHLRASDPESALALVEMLASVMAQRLSRTTALVHVYQR